MSVRNLINKLIQCNRDFDGQLQLLNGLLREVEMVKNGVNANFQGTDTLTRLLNSLENTENTLRKTETEIRKSQEKLRDLQGRLRG